MSPPLAKEVGLDGDLPISILTVLDFVSASDLSGEYAPGPIPSLGFSGRFSPILKDLTFELKR